MGIDNVNVHLHAHLEVSIHAPTRGATRTISVKVRNFLFQSTLPHGERPQSLFHPHFVAAFQSTLPHGERPVTLPSTLVSILFQSTLPHGERPRARRNNHPRHLFQSTLPHGERLRAQFIKKQGARFNPRSHTGSDKSYDYDNKEKKVSIHAPTRGAT